MIETRRKPAPIILVTTRSELASVEQGYASGCNDYMTKPIDGPELRRKVRALLGTPQAL